MNEGTILTADMLKGMPLAHGGAIPTMPQPTSPITPVAATNIASTSAPSPANFGFDYTIDLSRSYLDIEREILEAVIAMHDGSLPKAAKSLDLSPSTLYRKRDAWQDQDILDTQ